MPGASSISSGRYIPPGVIIGKGDLSTGRGGEVEDLTGALGVSGISSIISEINSSIPDFGETSDSPGLRVVVKRPTGATGSVTCVFCIISQFGESSDDAAEGVVTEVVRLGVLRTLGDRGS